MNTKKMQRELSDFGELSAAETRLLECSVQGQSLKLGEVRPASSDATRDVRASFVRFLALGGDQAVRTHERGVSLAGANVMGLLDLDLCRISGRLELVNCAILQGISAIDTEITALSLTGSRLSKLNAEGLVVRDNVLLNNDFRCDEGVDLSGAAIGGELNCVRGTFVNEHGDAFAAQSARIGEIFIWRDVTVTSGNVRLTGVHTDALADDLKSWPDGGRLMMDGFIYERIVYSDTSATRRLQWLEKHTSNEFQPQPYQQLAKVVGEMGHRFDRGRVLMAMEGRLRAQQRRDMRQGGLRVWAPLRQPWNWLRVFLHGLWSRVLHLLVGYGYRPWWALLWAIPIVIATSFAAQKVWDAGDFAPNVGPVLMSKSWQDLAADGAVANPAAVWSCTPPSGGDPADYPCEGMGGRDFETFKAPLYALDLFVPIINLGQEGAWAPSTSRSPLGRIAHNSLWIIKVVGWVITALVAGAVAGVIRND